MSGQSPSTNRHVDSGAHSHERHAVARAILIGSLLGLSWFGMQAVHEAGHVLMAWMTGGTVQQVHLSPWSISSTDVRPNPRPMLVTWAGPLCGSFAPLMCWLLARRCHMRGAYLLRFWAGFCLIANGAYLGAAAWWPVGDVQTLLQHGAPMWLMLLWGAVTIPLGLWSWHGQSVEFGAAGRPVNRGHAHALLAAFVGVVALLLSLE